jgi:hypothetical protein
MGEKRKNKGEAAEEGGSGQKDWLSGWPLLSNYLIIQILIPI